MFKKRTYQVNYSIPVNGEEYPREYVVRGVKNRESAEAVVRKYCGTTEIIITKITEL